MPVFNPTNSSEDVRLIGFEIKYDPIALASKPRPNWQGWATDGQYYERRQSGSTITYVRKYIVNNTPTIKDSLIATRTLCVSPFPTDSSKVIFAGGMDCNSIAMSRQAWIYRGDFRANPSTTVKSIVEKSTIVVYPNPFTNQINIENAKGDENFMLTNALGQTIYSGKNISAQDLSHLNNGVYFITITDFGQKTLPQSRWVGIKLLKQ